MSGWIGHETQYGDKVFPAEPPDWQEVVRIGRDLLGQTKDLRVACLVSRGLLALQGLTGFSDGVQLLRGYIEQYWDNVHPELDPDDDNDPTVRINTLGSLNDHSTTVVSLRKAILADGGVLGRFCLEDIEIVDQCRMPSQTSTPSGTPTLVGKLTAVRLGNPP